MGTPENQSMPPQDMPPATQPPAQPPPPPAAPAPHTPSPLSGFIASMSRAELFIAAGAALILLTDLIFVIFGPYGFSTVIWVASALALVAVLLHRRMPTGLAANYDWILVGLVAVALLLAVRGLVSDLVSIGRRSSLDIGIVLGMVGLYLGVALMAFGAWQIWQRRRA